jgi:FAD/FMN-containing dehydrogenase
VNATLLNALKKATGPDRVILDPEIVRSHATDWRGRYSGTPLCMVFPETVEAVMGVVRACSAENVPMVPQGGNTGLCGGATPMGGEVLVNLLRLNRVRWVDPDNRAMAVDAGCTLKQVQHAAIEAGLLFPLSLAAEGSATIGGNLSTNAGGVQVLRYGSVRNLTLGLEAVLPDGKRWNGMRSLRKDNTGYDLKDLFIGAEGTLGFITGAVLKLMPKPKSSLTAWLAVPTPVAARTVLRMLTEQLGDRLSAFELIDHNALGLVISHIPGTRLPTPTISSWQVLLEITDACVMDLEEAFTDVIKPMMSDVVLDVVIAHNEGQVADLWALRENISEAQSRERPSVKHDISLPVSLIPEFIERAKLLLSARYPDVRIVCFGHMGDGNLHYNLSMTGNLSNQSIDVLKPELNRTVHDLVHELGGSISAEHGLGQLKREEILRYKSDVEMQLMRTIKHAIDPLGLMNPGKVV